MRFPIPCLPLILLSLWLLGMTQVQAQSQVQAQESPVLTLSRGGESRVLSLAEIERHGLHEVEMRHFEGPEGRFAGVWLNDLLAAEGLDDAPRVRFVAYDDYTTFLTPAERAAKAYLLVTRLDGEPLGRDQFGPLMLVVPADTEAVLAGEEPMSRWIWSIREVSAR